MIVKQNLNIFTITTLVVIIISWLFVGVYRDNEFYEPQLFLKFRPTLKLHFYSPIGMQDLRIEDLPPEKQVEERAFREFVIEQNIISSPDNLWFVPYVLIQLSLTLSMFSAAKGIQNISVKITHPLSHVIVCLFPTGLGLVFLLAFNRWWTTLILGAAIILLNLIVLLVMTKQQIFAKKPFN